MKLASRSLLAALAGAAMLALGGCATPERSGSVYTTRDTRQPMQVQTATVQSVRTVRIEREGEPGVGTAAGAVIGGVAGSNVGGGKGSIIGSVVGAVAGGVAGSYLEKGVTDRNGLEITVRTDDGRTLAIVQDAGNDRFDAGQRVRLLTDGRGQVRVSPL